MTEKKQVRSYCRRCERETNHSILSKEERFGSDEYPEKTTYQIVECQGCNAISFREIYEDYNSAYPSDEEGENWIVPEHVSIYPKSIRDHHSQIKVWMLPNIVRNIYQELLDALRSDASILAGLGLRACIEAVCNDLKIDGRTLEARINKLQISGNISKKDAERLHGIRFMGNDAAHEIKNPKSESLSVALKIVEHLLQSVYILEKEADGKLEAAISDYLIFEKLLESKLSEFKKGDELPLARYLGQDLRRVASAIVPLENELISRIQAGKYAKLALGKVDFYQNSKEQRQHFVLVDQVQKTSDFDPFFDELF